jgi:streptomycin 6-kinase
LGAAEAERWLAGAVNRAEQLFDAWDLEPEQVLGGGSESLCVKCTGADGDTVLKLPASVSGGADEIAALRAWDGNGAPRVLRAKPEHNAMLMPFLGWVGEGDYTLPEVLDLADRLHGGAPTAYEFPSLEANLDRRVDWARDRFAEVDDQEALDDVDAAEKVLDDIVGMLSGADPVLLHGDLQPKNFIVSDAGLAVVDPLPAVGPALFDLALYVVKCVHDHDLTTCQDEVLELRPDLDPDLLRRWCWALAVLESRPYLGDLNARRVEFIRHFRDAL